MSGKHLTVDSTYVRANAALKSLEPIVVSMDSREYIEKVDKENRVEEGPWEPRDDYPARGQKISNGTHRSKTDPDGVTGEEILESEHPIFIMGLPMWRQWESNYRRDGCGETGLEDRLREGTQTDTKDRLQVWNEARELRGG